MEALNKEIIFPVILRFNHIIKYQIKDGPSNFYYLPIIVGIYGLCLGQILVVKAFMDQKMDVLKLLWQLYVWKGRSSTFFVTGHKT